MKQIQGFKKKPSDCVVCEAIVLELGTQHYAIVAGISHDIAFGMCHVECKGITHDHVVYVLTMWYLLTMSYVFKTTENFHFCYLNVRND